MALPIDPGKVKKVADKIQKEIHTDFCIDVYFDNSCNEKFLNSMKSYFEAMESDVAINYKDVEARPIYCTQDFAFAVIIAGKSPDSTVVYNNLSEAGQIKFVISANPTDLIEHFEDGGIPYSKNEIICPDIKTYSKDKSNPELIDFDDYNNFMDLNIKSKISNYIYTLSETMELAYAEKFPFLRSRIATNLIYTCALENGGIGIIKILPGADMPLMTLNQVRMLLQLAAIYGYQINEDRVIEIVTIVASAFCMRYLSKYVKKNSPIPKFIVDGSFGFSATMLLGNLVKEYFANGYAIDGLVEKCKAFFQK